MNRPYSREGQKTLATECRNRVTIQSNTPVSDGQGGFAEAWSTIGPVWAAVNPIRATQQSEYKSIGVDATHLIKIRGAVSIAEKNRIVWGARVFEVLTVEDLQERGIIKVCTCKERR
jgi:SPP1 family predicted phage head-tail adaptor